MRFGGRMIQSFKYLGLASFVGILGLLEAKDLKGRTMLLSCIEAVLIILKQTYN